MGFSTDAIHAGQPTDPTTGAVVPPLHLSTTFEQSEPGRHKGFDYARTVNPTRLALERNLTTLERGEWGSCFSSGMAAITTLLQTLRTGDRVLVTANCYGGTYRVLRKVFDAFGVASDFIDTGDPGVIERSIDERTRLLIVETPTNPNLGLCDIRATSELTRRRGILLAVDNTFATPYLQRPLELGADIVIHSLTKYLGGHSDSVGGALIGIDPELGRRVAFIQNAAGAVLSPFDSWLVLRGVKTLAVRLDRLCQSASQIARFLEGHEKVRRVYYPGLESHPGHALAKRQMRLYGGIVSFDVGSLAAATQLAQGLKLIVLAESLGAVETLVNHPAIMTHGSIPREQREEHGITDGLLRISVGLEDLDDLLADLEGALKRL